MNNYPKISIVTVNYNNGEFLEDTIKSVIEQEYPNLEYILIDGGSTDNSLEVIERYKEHFAYWVSEPDGGQYQAIQKGFEKSSGEIMAWLNSDDKYLPRSLFKVAEIFDKYEEVNWLMGLAREYTEDGALVGQITLPWCRWSKYRYLTNDFQFIQQESSFWTRELWEKSGGTLDFKYDLAGDMELWARFFRFEKLHTTALELSGFRHRKEGQRSKVGKKTYLEEAHQLVRREQKRMSVLGKIGLPLRYLVKWCFGPFFFWDWFLIKWIYRVSFNIPGVIYYDFYHHDFTKKPKMSKLPPRMIAGRQVHRKMFSQK
ncbi:MAG: glycosyltransferase family 2 protein [Crocinitomicaceae bacterium]|nr:glycosyltransferase family 2 protein [Crocinitomicaceae bacterium]